MGKLVPGTPREHEARGPRRADQRAMYSSYHLSSFAWFISGDGPKGIRRCGRKNPPSEPGDNDIGFNIALVWHQRFLLDHWSPQSPRRARIVSQLSSYSAA